jgi:hypothetical protein
MIADQPDSENINGDNAAPSHADITFRSQRLISSLISAWRTIFMWWQKSRNEHQRSTFFNKFNAFSTHVKLKV